MIQIEITGLTELQQTLTQTLNRWNSYFPAMEENIQETLIMLIAPEAPFITGNLLNHLLPKERTQEKTSIGIDESFVPYVFRVMYGFKKDGTEFSKKGHELFERLLPQEEEIVNDEVDKFINTVFENLM